MKRAILLATGGLLLAVGNVSAVEVEIPGLLTDHTVSSVGHDFYRAFSDKWESSWKGNLTINERPSARWGSWITIAINQQVVYQTFLFPTRRDFTQNVDIALEQTQQALERQQINQALLSIGDLASDEY
ncbi:curli production assembly/transport protein CsgE [Kosakonia sp. H02]|nr:curli production assembly/transport protein CsgE [Kosakonia sp. H02]